MSTSELAKVISEQNVILKQLRDQQIQAVYQLQTIAAHLSTKPGADFLPVTDAARLAGSTAKTSEGARKFFRSYGIEPVKVGGRSGFYSSDWPTVLESIRSVDADKRRSELALVG